MKWLAAAFPLFKRFGGKSTTWTETQAVLCCAPLLLLLLLVWCVGGGAVVMKREGLSGLASRRAGGAVSPFGRRLSVASL